MKTSKTKLLLTFFISGFFLFGLAGVSEAADHNWYFSMSGGGSVCSQASPCKWLSSNQVGYVAGQTTAQNKIDSVDSSKTVNLYFKRGDTWETNTLVKRQVHGLLIESDDPIVNIDAYGSGDLPCMDGLITDFSTAPVHNTDTGPLRWSYIFNFSRTNCSVSNMEFKQIYGDVIKLKDADSFELIGCNAHHIGQAVTIVDTATGINNCLFEYNTAHTGQELWRYGLRPAGWGGALCTHARNTASIDNIIRYNLVYDIFGEGIINHGGITEYNLVGDTYSTGIYVPPFNHDGVDTIVRYNFVTMNGNSDYQSPYPIPSIHNGRASHNGIGFIDEWLGGSNANSDIEIYGNVIINRYYGIYAKNSTDVGNPFKSIKIYNNTVIDSILGNYIIAQPEEFTNGYIYNNSSILYNRITAIHGGHGATFPHSNWTIDNNHFWTTGGSPTVDDGWQTNMVTTNPKLPGEPAIDWDGQSGPTYYKDIKFSDVYPLAGSALIGSGKTLGAGYNKIFLTTGTDFSTLPNSTNFTLSSQTDGSWDIGAIEYGGVPIPDPTCASQSGTCCNPGWTCSGSSVSSSNCSTICCTGTCENTASTDTCTSEGYQCCNSCGSETAYPKYNGSCPGKICCEACYVSQKIEVKNFISVPDFPKLVQNILMWSLSIIGSLALLMIIIGGIMYMSSTGDEQRVLTAKKIVTYAIIGLALILIAYSIIKVLDGILN